MNRAAPTHTESIQIAARPHDIYAIVADVTKASELSPEARRCEWIGQPAAPWPGRAFAGTTAGAGFRWSREAQITTADPGREFAFQTIPGRGIHHDMTRWRYTFEPTATGTLVTESYAVHAPAWLLLMDAALGRPAALARGIRATLSALKHTAGHTR